MFDMFMDKLGAMTVLSSFQTVVKEKIKINLTCSIGLVENFINENSYRPSDIITSRKGLTVEIGNTDAEGRLVLADCMNWVQEHYKVDVMIELSTLTGAIISALGTEYTGLFSNDEDLTHDLKKVGEKVHERSWHLPCTKYHMDMITPKHCDLTNHAGRTEAGSSQAAAFLKSFVEPNTKWAHLDIAGTSMVSHAATGWGSRLLVEYARHYSHKH
jgi:leucyl aminopeptidase